MAFETLGVNKLGFIQSAVPKLFSRLQYTGLVVDFGHELTRITSVKNGHVDIHNIKEIPVGGKNVD